MAGIPSGGGPPDVISAGSTSGGGRPGPVGLSRAEGTSSRGDGATVATVTGIVVRGAAGWFVDALHAAVVIATASAIEDRVLTARGNPVTAVPLPGQQRNRRSPDRVPDRGDRCRRSGRVRVRRRSGVVPRAVRAPARARLRVLQRHETGGKGAVRVRELERGGNGLYHSLGGTGGMPLTAFFAADGRLLGAVRGSLVGPDLTEAIHTIYGATV